MILSPVGVTFSVGSKGYACLIAKEVRFRLHFNTLLAISCTWMLPEVMPYWKSLIFGR